jgi:hypothetical protein
VFVITKSLQKEEENTPDCSTLLVSCSFSFIITFSIFSITSFEQRKFENI